MDKYFKIVKRFRGADALWTNNSTASTILNNEFFNVQTIENASVILSDFEFSSDISTTATADSNTSVSEFITYFDLSINSIGNSVANLSEINFESNFSISASGNANYQLIDFDLVSNVDLTANGSAETSIEILDSTIRIDGFNFEANSSVNFTEFNSSFNFDVSAIGNSIANIVNLQLINSLEISAYSDSEVSIEPFENSFEFSITASFLDLSKNEVVFLKSYMTKKIAFAFNSEKQHKCYSYSTNKNINKSKITNEINNLSLITYFVNAKSRITNSVKTNSKIV